MNDKLAQEIETAIIKQVELLDKGGIGFTEAICDGIYKLALALEILENLD